MSLSQLSGLKEPSFQLGSITDLLTRIETRLFIVFLPHGMRRYTQHQENAHRLLSLKLPNWDTWPENRREAITQRRLVGEKSE